jgi:hypothetical protein
MATFLDVGLLENFGAIFIVLLVFLIVFGLMEYIKPFGEAKRGLHGIIAVAIALVFIVSKVATKMVSFMVPWFMVMAIFVFFMLFIVRMFGAGEGDMKKLIKDSNVYVWLIVFGVLILIFAISSAFGQSLLEKGAGTTVTVTASNVTAGTGTGADQTIAGTTSTATPSFQTNLLNTLRHPKVIGLLFVFLVAVFALIFLTKPAS